MKIIDISWSITPEMTSYKDNKSVEFIDIKNFETDGVRDTKIVLSAHTGTHIDAPAHFLEHGYIESIPLDRMIGPCTVIDLTSVDKITSKNLEHIQTGLIQTSLLNSRIVLFKTKNSFLKETDPFNHEFVYLDESGARCLAEKKITAVGTDYLGIERDQKGHETHKILLENNIVIIEGLRLKDVEPGDYIIYCLPLKVIGLEASPVRAILIKD